MSSKEATPRKLIHLVVSGEQFICSCGQDSFIKLATFMYSCPKCHTMYQGGL